MKGLVQALASWDEILGADGVETRREEIAPAEQATFQCDRHIAAILFPATTEELQECIKIAGENGMLLYPVSRGKNWGLGSRLPACNDCVLVDLSRMNRIVAYDEKLSYLTVEPGVTFAQATTFLRQRNSASYLSVIGGPPEASIIGNAMERGDGVGRYGDRSSHACAMEVVLPSGERIHTGFGRYSRATSTSVHGYGVGP